MVWYRIEEDKNKKKKKMINAISFNSMVIVAAIAAIAMGFIIMNVRRVD